MTKGRVPARDEIPRFGSAWQYGTDTVYIVLGLVNRDFMGAPAKQLRYIEIRKPLDARVVADGGMWWWVQPGGVVTGWRCIDEGPDL